ncbi:MAG: caspase family protein [Polyangiaceae bacterium]
MATGRSLHIGLNNVLPDAYGGWDGALNACEADAVDMRAIAQSQRFDAKTLFGGEAKRAGVLAELDAAARALRPGDFFLLTFSGHGGQVVDVNGDEHGDHLDETWCLFDGQLIDDELVEACSKFSKGVRLVVLSDSCHSGGLLRPSLIGAPAAPAAPDPAGVSRSMPQEIVGRAYRAQQALYDSLQASPAKTEADIKASLVFISACQDPQLALDGTFNGAFTRALLRVWNDGTFRGNYRTFHSAIQFQLPLTQQPNLETLGSGRSFVLDQPFRI